MKEETTYIAKRPICAECGCNTLVLFTPPKEDIVGTEYSYKTIGTPDYVDWNKAHLYCCNGETNCKTTYYLNELTTPLDGLKVKIKIK